MPFAESWDEASPTDGDNAYDIDDFLRSLKTAIRERLAVDHYTYADESGHTDVGRHRAGTHATLYVGTTTEINALTGMDTDSWAFDTDLSVLKRYTGAAWEAKGHAASHATGASDALDALTVTNGAALGQAVTARARFGFSSTTAITVSACAYHVAGATNYVAYVNTSLTFTLGSGGSNAGSTNLGNNEWHYIYIDDSAMQSAGTAVLAAARLINSTTAPTWSDAKNGWYNGADRCIFAVRTDGSAQIREFFHVGDQVQFADEIEDAASTTDIDNAWTDVTLTVPLFNAPAIVTFIGVYGSANKEFYWRTNGQTGTVGKKIFRASANTQVPMTTCDVIPDATGKIEVIADASNNTTIGAYTVGWKFPNRM
jgi:hypothetical protein